MDKVLEHILARSPRPQSWGRVLDAGTGESSLAWVSRLPCSEWTAVTADESRAQGLRRRFPPGKNRLLVGNWQDPRFLERETFDVVIADYLLGSCDRYAPHFQEQLLERLLGVCRGWLFIVGQEPWSRPTNPAQRCLWNIAQLRDAVQLLLDRRPHRELPQDWVERQLARYGHPVNWSERFENHYDQEYVLREVNAIEENLHELADKGLAQLLRRRCHTLRQTNAAGVYGWDYLLAVNVAQPAAIDRPPH